MADPTAASLDAKVEVLADALLFLVRHGAIPNLADAFVADLHRASAHDAERSRYVRDLVERLRERDAFVAEDDA